MTSQPAEGQTIPPNCTLQRRLHQDQQGESWLARDNATGDSLFIRFFHDDMPDWSLALGGLEKCRGLVHENIARTIYVSPEGEQKYLVMPYYEGGEHFGSSDPYYKKPQALDKRQQNKPLLLSQLRQLISVLKYTHQLGMAHGHLHPGNLIVDVAGNLHVTGYGLPASFTVGDGSDDVGDGGGGSAGSHVIDESAAFLSPEAMRGTQPDPSDDMYSLGCLIFWCLTGKRYAPDTALDSPLPASLDRMLDTLLDPSPYKRTLDLDDLEEALRRHFEGVDDTIAPVSFARPGAEQPDSPASAPASASEAVQIGRGQRQVSSFAVVAGLVVALVIVALLFFLPESKLPQVAAPSQQPAATVTQTLGTSELSPLQQAQQEQRQKQADEMAREILRLQVELEDLG
ncbi:MAG: serine/threonine protein kinase, partial [Pseudomonadales bacterium]